MASSIETAPYIVHELKNGPTSVERDALPGFEVRTMGLEAAADRLHMQVADLGTVATARALADVACCPVCRTRRRRAA